MVTRFYLPSSGAAAVSPAYTGDWDDETVATRLKCDTTKIASAMTNFTGATNASTLANEILLVQYVSDPIAAQTISGTVKGQIRCIEADALANAKIAFGIKVVTNDGSQVRGYLAGTNLALKNSSTEILTALTNTPLKDGLTTPINLTSINVHNNDRIVIELGFVETASAVYNISMNFGDDSATDLPEDATDTNAYNPWIEFSVDITDATPPTTPTRYYLPSTGTADISPAYAAWTNTSVTVRRELVSTRINSAMTNFSFNGALLNRNTVLLIQYVSNPIGAQIVASDIKMQIRGLCDTANAINLSIGIRIVSNDGTVVRGTLLNPGSDSDDFSNVTLTNRSSGTLLTGTVTSLNNDRVVIEIGFILVGVDATITGTENFGDDSATDLPENDTETSAYNPWIEFVEKIVGPSGAQIKKHVIDLTARHIRRIIRIM